MKLNKILFSAMLLAGCLSASAEEQGTTREAFNPHWYVQGQFGGQYTTGEVAFKDLLSLNAQVAGGYNFTPVWGVRLAVGGWQSKGGSDLSYIDLGTQTWKYYYIAPTVDATCNLTNWFLGYNTKRVFDFGLIAGAGVNIGFHNNEAWDVLDAINASPVHSTSVDHMTDIWCGTKARFVGKFGIYGDFHLTRRVDLGFEVNANTLVDSYNSKHAGNADWYFNALAGVKVNLGKTRKSVPVEKEVVAVAVAAPVAATAATAAVKPAEKPAEPVAAKAEKAEPLRRDIFFNIRESEVRRTEMPKVEDVVTYLNKYPEAKVSITGYADKGTGNPKINMGYAKQRAEMVATLLIKSYGIDASRISVDSKGDTEQPFEVNDLNRVSICIAE